MDASNSQNASSPLGSFLRGVRILDLSQYIPGPMATLFLSDMGADVLKVEPPLGDPMQELGPRDLAGRPVYYETLNAGKRAVRIDLKTEAGRSALLGLAQEADILVEGFRPGVMKRLGIDYPVLSAANPRLIMCSISGYGRNASLGTRAGHDANYLAITGVAHRNGQDGPEFYDPPVADSAGSLFAVIAMLGALQGRQRTGKGCLIDLALADAVMPLQMVQIADFGANGTVPARNGYYLNGGAAYYQIYRTADGHYAVLGAVEPKFWANFCNAAERPDLIARQAEPAPQDVLIQDIATLFATMTAEEIARRFGDKDCCVSIVSDLGEALAGRQVQERQLVVPSHDGALQSLFPAWVDGQPPGSRNSLQHVPSPGSAAWQPKSTPARQEER